MKVQGHGALDKRATGAVVNTDHKAYLRAKQKKEEKLRIDRIEEKLDKLTELLGKLLNE